MGTRRDPLQFTRRDFGKLALAGLPLSLAFAEINSKFKGVQIGAITYSFRTMPNPEDIIKAYVTIGLGEMELMSGDAEKLAGAPIPMTGRGGGRGPGGPPAPGPAPAGAPPSAASPVGPPPSAAPPIGPPPGGAPSAPGTPAGGMAPGAAPGRQGGGRRAMTPEEQTAADARAAELRKWRMSATASTFTPVKKRIEDAGIQLRILCYNMNVNSTKDDEIEYAFMMAKALGVKAISTSTQVSMAKRTAPFADKHKIPLAFHGHDATDRPDEVSTPETFATILAASKYHAINLDIGHFTAANFDPVAYIQEHHDRITHLHLKDRKKDHGANVPWGQGDTPIKQVLLLLRDKKYDMPGNIEFEYPGDPMVEIPKCVQFCKDTLNG
jgi:sugar phosphate isomerase/epimerase